MIRLLIDHDADPDRSEGDVTPVGLTKRIAGVPKDIIALLESKSTSG